MQAQRTRGPADSDGRKSSRKSSRKPARRKGTRLELLNAQRRPSVWKHAGTDAADDEGSVARSDPWRASLELLRHEKTADRTKSGSAAGGWQGMGLRRRTHHCGRPSFIRKNPMRVASFHRASQENTAREGAGAGDKDITACASHSDWFDCSSSPWRKSFGLRTSRMADFFVGATRSYHCGYCFVAPPRTRPFCSSSLPKHFRHGLLGSDLEPRWRRTKRTARSGRRLQLAVSLRIQLRLGSYRSDRPLRSLADAGF
jgi:hypothetical protein